jgi:hypothetical protein
MYKHNIAIVICWSGEWPWYFKFFLHSVRFNPTIDFLIITDTQNSEDLPGNIKMIYKSLEEIADLASKKLFFNAVIGNPYKLNDYKPAYGLIFEDYLMEYDFWGHGDIDIIFGNIRKFMTNEMLDEYDFITVRHDFIAGFFSLFKNNELMKTLFKESKDYQKVFSSSRHYCFDECNFLHPQLKWKIPIEQIPCEIESMEHVIRKSAKAGLIMAHYDFLVVESNPGKLRWENGELFYKEKFEALFFHLIRFKKLPFLIKPLWNKIPNVFFIHQFYISMYKPNSTKGTVERVLSNFKSETFKAKTQLKWQFSDIAGSLKRGNKEKETQKYLGAYRSNNSVVGIGMENELNNIFILEGTQVTPLKKVKANEFIAKKTGLRVTFNITDQPHFLIEDVFKWGADKRVYYKM